MELKNIEEEIYSKAVITNEDIPREAIKKITGKYDSLNRQKCHTISNMPSKPPRALFLTREFEDLHQLSNNGNNTKDFVVFDGEKNTEFLRQNSVRGYNAYMNSISPAQVTLSQAQNNNNNNTVQHVQAAIKKTYSGDHFDCNNQFSQPVDADRPTKTPPTGATELTEEDFVQIEMFFRSHNTEVYVGQCVSTMYFSITPRDAPPPHCTPQNSSRWTKIKQGVPVLVHDTGAGRRKRQLSINLSEVGTGFILWREIINEYTHYKVITPCFHTMTVAEDNNRLIGLDFDDPSSAAEFVIKLKTISCNFQSQNVLPDSTQTSEKPKSKKKNKYKAPNKADISSPCCFTHVTNLDRSKNIKPKVKVETHQRKSHSLPRRLSPNKLPKLLHFLPNDT